MIKKDDKNINPHCSMVNLEEIYKDFSELYIPFYTGYDDINEKCSEIQEKVDELLKILEYKLKMNDDDKLQLWYDNTRKSEKVFRHVNKQGI